MKIEGLTSRQTVNSGRKIVIEFVPEGEGSYRHLRLSLHDQNMGVIEVIEGKVQPALDPCESVTVLVTTEASLIRVVKAMARIHLGLENGENDYTDVDVEMIRRGFQVGKSDDDKPVWIRMNSDSSMMIVAITEDGGLPAHHTSPACLLYRTPNGKNVTARANDMKAVLRLIDTNKVREFVNPNGDVELEGVSLQEELTLH